MRLRSVLGIALAVGVAVASEAADPYRLDESHSSVEFKIRHLIGNVTGRFGDFEGTLPFAAADPTRSSIRISIRAASIDTAEPKRDEHLRSPDFFDADTYPEMTFESARIARRGDDLYQVTGRFSMHGVTKELTIPVEFLGAARDPWGNERVGFSSIFPLNRKDWGIVWNKTLDAGGLLLGDEVTATIHLELVRETPPPAAASK